MAREVVWAKPALLDLKETAEYIARDSRMYAVTFVERMTEAVRTLPVFPLRGRVVPELGDEKVRELLLGSYRLLYEVTEDQITVVGVIHGARELAALWIRENRSPSIA